MQRTQTQDNFSRGAFEQKSCPEHGIYYIDKFSSDSCPYCQYIKLSYENEKILNFPLKYIELLMVHKKLGIHFINFIKKSSKELFEYIKKLKDFDIYLIETYSDPKDFYKKQLDHFGRLSGYNFDGSIFHWDKIWAAKSKAIAPLRDCLAEMNQGRCTICNRPLKQPTLDHMHTRKVKGTGFIRNVCCSQCNTFLARSENNASRHGISNKELPDVLRRIADHLENQTKIIHSTEIPKKKKLNTRTWNKIVKFYFKVYPGRKKLPQRPRYITENIIEIAEKINNYIIENNKKDKLINLDEIK